MAMQDRHTRQAAERRGRLAEHIAEMWLRLKGYRILDRRVRLPMGEIDLIAQRGGVVAFVEVKQRASLNAAQDAVPERAWRRISAAAGAWIARRQHLTKKSCRYDLIAISRGHRPHHYPDYWRP